ncbi:hypothetical protein P3T18_003481 [Paraburkholderia sp. GAS199]|uniref:hypothetical protein n=1 Tax=Paraburkholderia sp. GAS199 TaxID=3035126 RepID=UPI003D21FF8C
MTSRASVAMHWEGDIAGGSRALSVRRNQRQGRASSARGYLYWLLATGADDESADALRVKQIGHNSSRTNFQKLKMKSILLAVGACLALGACAIEGIGMDGRMNAYQNAARDGNDYVVLHQGARDGAWYADWCNAVLPHFERMSEEKNRIIRYCGAMQQQPENAASIQTALSNDLDDTARRAATNRNAALGALAASMSQRPPAINCVATKYGNTVDTHCQ